jgi:hypothetical protein
LFSTTEITRARSLGHPFKFPYFAPRASSRVIGQAKFQRTAKDAPRLEKITMNVWSEQVIRSVCGEDNDATTTLLDRLQSRDSNQTVKMCPVHWSDGALRMYKALMNGKTVEV